MMTSALLAISAVIVAPFAENAPEVACAAPDSGDVTAGDMVVVEIEGDPGLVDAVVETAAAPVCGAPLSAPVSIPRSVCATRTTSAFLRYTMNMLPPGRPGVSMSPMS